MTTVIGLRLWVAGAPWEMGARAGPGSRRVTITDPARSGLLLTRISWSGVRSLLTDAGQTVGHDGTQGCSNQGPVGRAIGEKHVARVQRRVGGLGVNGPDAGENGRELGDIRSCHRPEEHQVANHGVTHLRGDGRP